MAVSHDEASSPVRRLRLEESYHSRSNIALSNARTDHELLEMSLVNERLGLRHFQHHDTFELCSFRRRSGFRLVEVDNDEPCACPDIFYHLGPILEKLIVVEGQQERCDHPVVIDMGCVESCQVWH